MANIKETIQVKKSKSKKKVTIKILILGKNTLFIKNFIIETNA